jgi:hypothetical protein
MRSQDVEPDERRTAVAVKQKPKQTQVQQMTVLFTIIHDIKANTHELISAETQKPHVCGAICVSFVGEP